MDTVTRVLNTARVLLGQRDLRTLDAVSGKLLDWTQPACQQLTNSAWRKLQARLAERRYSGLKVEMVFYNVPISGTGDPSKQSYMSFAEFWDGAGTHVAPVLPATLLRPYALTERIAAAAPPPPPTVVFGGAVYTLQPGQSVSGSANFTEMDERFDTLPRVQKKAWNQQWVWRSGALYLPGALSATDIALTFGQLLPDFADVGTTPWFAASVPLLNCADAFAEYICREVYVSLGQIDKVAAMETSAEAGVQLILNQDGAIIPAEGGQ